MRRKLEEVLASQKQMLVRRGEPTDRVSDERLRQLFQKHLQRVAVWLDEQPNFAVIYVDYNEVLDDPVVHVNRINQFLGNTLDVEKMAGVVDKSLYRQRQ